MSAAGCSCRRCQRNHFLMKTRSSRPCRDHPIQCFSFLIGSDHRLLSIGSGGHYGYFEIWVVLSYA
jgi:hypothetical protein